MLPLFGANAPYVANAIPTQSLNAGGNSTTVSLDNVFALTGVTGPLVEFVFSGGRMFIETYPTTAPQTVANFLKYADNKIYDDTIVHRSEPGFVIQAGGYQWTSSLPHVPTYAPVPNEFSILNTAGTMAMAKLGNDLNSATSEWFVNLVDNPSLDTDTQKFTVFGRLVGDGLAFCQSIAALQRVDLFPSDPNDAFNTVPVVNYTSGSVMLSNLLVLRSVRQIPLVKLDSTISGYLVPTATSSDSSVITPTITSSGLQLTSGASPGDATITVKATDYSGLFVSTSFLAHSVATPTPTPTITYQVSAARSPARYGAVRNAGSYPSGTVISLKAIPKVSRHFKNWTEGGRVVSRRATYTFAVSAPRKLVANFTAN